MATFRIPIFGPGLKLDDDGFSHFISMQNLGANFNGGTNDEFAMIFENNETTLVHGSFKVPVNYSSATTDPAFIIPWTSDTTTGDVNFQVLYNAIADGEDIDPTTSDQNITFLDVAPGTAGLIQSAIIPFTRANFVANDIVRFRFGRFGGSPGDDLEDRVVIMHNNVMFRYSDV